MYSAQPYPRRSPVENSDWRVLHDFQVLDLEQSRDIFTSERPITPAQRLEVLMCAYVRVLVYRMCLCIACACVSHVCMCANAGTLRPRVHKMRVVRAGMTKVICRPGRIAKGSTTSLVFTLGVVEETPPMREPSVDGQ